MKHWLVTFLSLVGLVTATQAKPPLVLITLQQDGSFVVDGKRHTDPHEMKVILENLERHVPVPEICLTAPAGSTEAAVQKAIKLFQDAGVSKFGVLIEPRSQ